MSNLTIFGGVCLVFVLGIGYVLWKNRKSDKLKKLQDDAKKDLLG
jgi:hypothetical protein